jgi:hypothetical protein
MAKRINMSTFNKKLSTNRAFKSELRKKASEKIESSKALLLSDFNSHPVTKEIEGGASSANISGTLGGYGNLYTFIGFAFGNRPTSVVKSLLATIKAGKVKKSRSTRNRASVEVEIQIPTKEAFYKATPLPFESGRSWLYGIESGISGFGSYFYKKWQGSRSGNAFQADKKVRGGGFRNTSYFSGMLLAFTKRIR